ncbi:aminopeptidase PepB [Avibacterium sp. 20-15]|uniref:aminopeptidase PepB n=1 Tax=unclassified Avibacterium TaxID=2685287 RepID=UPI002025EEAC|nr:MULTISPECIES: aminopeptidase PepB [unclassified Avibacterium]MCW9733367.1 aminopeptidase PepB [Avibacterium sp. 20-15]URL03241.1 aminopeptidase PepB [Avibacterium sp. 20-132]
MLIHLSTQPASPVWGENALLSFSNDEGTVHIKQNSPNSDRTLIQKAARKLRNQGIKEVELVGEDWDLENCWAFYQGFYSAKQDYAIEFPHLDDEPQAELFARIQCGDFVREIINLPSDVITPKKLAERSAQFIAELAAEYACESAVSFEIISAEALLEKNYQGIWNVGKASSHKPAMLQLDFNPSQDPNAPVLACLVGKGITFDSGGYSLKPSDSMSTMRTDMGGAALVTGALGMAIAGGLNQRVKLYLCCAENMVSAEAMKLGDIITYRNGITAEVLNTDAEGRLVLADGLIDADKQNPQFIIDCATLTGAAKIAVGNDYHSVLSMDNELVADLFNAAQISNEPFWRLPFEEFHRHQISSSFAQIANIGTVPVGAGASTATAFLSYFVKNYQQHWLHIDCSATYRKSASDLWAAGATGIGVQTLAHLLLNKANS